MGLVGFFAIAIALSAAIGWEVAGFLRSAGLKQALIASGLIAMSLLMLAYSIVNAIGAGFLTLWSSGIALGFGLRWLVTELVASRRH
jgi:hypothetical protein